MSITSDIKEFALDLGYSWAGVTNTLGFPDYLTELKNRYEIYTWYIEKSLGSDIIIDISVDDL
jgi:epoxyqueuosine reductase